MQTVDIALPVMHPAQKHIDKTAKRFTLIRAGRRFGKDILMERRLIRRTSDVSQQGWFAPSYRMMTENFKSIANRLAPIIVRKTESLHRLELVNGATIEFWSLDNFDASRGRKYGHITINEASMAPNLRDAWNFVIRPTLADMRGGADMGGTPKGLNYFYELERDAGADWSVFHYTTYDNPYIPREEIEAMKQSLPERVWKQEIMAEYMADGSFFQNVDACCVLDKQDIPDNHKGHRFTAGLDWALSEDFTRLVVICATCGKAVDWWGGNRMDYSMQIQFIVERLKKWPGVLLLPERNSIGVPNIENLSKLGIMLGVGPDGGFGYQTTAMTKSPLIMRLALLMEKGEIKLPTETINEFRSFEVEVTTANPKFSAPSGQHDDWVIASALAVWLAASPIQIFL